MKRFILTCAFMMISASSAMATLYSNQTTTDSGNANSGFTPSVGWTTSIPASSIAASNAMLIHISAYGSGTGGYVEPKLNGQSLGIVFVDSYDQVDINVRVTRYSSSQALITGTVTYAGAGVVDWSSIAGPVTFTSGLSFGSAQNLTVELSNSVPGGTHFYYGGVQR